MPPLPLVLLDFYGSSIPINEQPVEKTQSMSFSREDLVQLLPAVVFLLPQASAHCREMPMTAMNGMTFKLSFEPASLDFGSSCGGAACIRARPPKMASNDKHLQSIEDIATC